MKCSLLTLSTFIDGELAPQRRAEVDAHLVGCTRCSAGAATLREERSRIGQLARVSVDAASAQVMLEQVGIATEPHADVSATVAPPAPSPPDLNRPWQEGTRSAALPWTPRRPDPIPPVPVRAGAEVIVPAMTPDPPPDLPLDGVRSVPPSWNRPATDGSPPPAPAPAQGEGVAADADQFDTWEADLPPPGAAAPPVAAEWAAPAPPPIDPIEPPTPPGRPELPAPATPPTRLAAASGPGALWSRIHDAITVRLALARGGDALEDSVQIVSGAPAPRGAQLPERAPEPVAMSGIVAAPPTPQMPGQLDPPSEVELDGFGGIEHAQGIVHPAAAPDLPAVTPITGEPLDRRYREPTPVTDDRADPEAGDSVGWNAFAASSYPELDMPAEQTVEQRQPRPLGRHSRAVAREQVPLSTRIGRAMTAAAAAVRSSAGAATGRTRQAAGRLGSSGPDNRLLAGIAGIGLIFVVALLIGHSSARPPAPAAARSAPATSAAPPHQSAPAQSSAASSASVPAATGVQTFGAGNTGFQVIRLRYGLQAGFSRVVFDLGAATSGAVGTPRVTVSFSSPTTLLVTLDGTVPAGSTGSPPPGKLISSVSLVSSTANKTVYRFALTRAATTTAFYLASPTRFVLDIH